MIIGAGIVGLAVARAMLLKHPGKRILVLEKETQIGAHQTGRNSGVIHAGVYYKPGSLKAKLCVEGSRRMYEYADEKGVAHDHCGKVIVATREEELGRLETLYERGVANGVPGIERIDGEQVREHEPHVSALRGLWVPSTGIIDFPGVAAAMRDDFEAMGGTIALGAGVQSIRSTADGWVFSTAQGDCEARALINCGGLYCDRIALMAGANPNARIVPFRGEYYRLRPEREGLVRNLIYPVPDPAFPFLGVHFTRTMKRGTEAGPNAVLALAREGYSKRNVNVGEALGTASWPGFQKVAARYWRTGLAEMARSASKSKFTQSLQQLVPEVTEDDLVQGGSGVRAQAITRDGALVDDFLIETQPQARALHLLNAPSPAATASLAIADYIVENYAAGLVD